MNCVYLIYFWCYYLYKKTFIKSDQFGNFFLMLTQFQSDEPAGGPADNPWTQ